MVLGTENIELDNAKVTTALNAGGFQRPAHRSSFTAISPARRSVRLHFPHRGAAELIFDYKQNSLANDGSVTCSH